MAREILFDLGKMITDRLPYKFGIKRLTEEDPEYILLDRSLESDEQAEIMLKMGLRKPKTLDVIAKITGKDPKHVEELLEKAAQTGAVEYNWENPQHEKQYYVQLFVPGIAEMTNMVLKQVEKYPELADSFDNIIAGFGIKLNRTSEVEPRVACKDRNLQLGKYFFNRIHVSLSNGCHFILALKSKHLCSSGDLGHKPRSVSTGSNDYSDKFLCSRIRKFGYTVVVFKVAAVRQHDMRKTSDLCNGIPDGDPNT